MTSPSPPGRRSGHSALTALLSGAHALLLDFDGPITRFFEGYDTAVIAEEIKELLAEHGVPLPDTVLASTDPHALLQLLRSEVFTERRPGLGQQKTLELAEGIVTDHEYRVVGGAPLDTHVKGLLELLARRGKRLVVVSNNAEGPVRAYLERHGLRGMFDAVFGRDPVELRHMKPHPDCVRRALHHLVADPKDCLLVGDQLTDLAAARAAGVPFLGYARTAQVAARMRDNGAAWADITWEPLLAAARKLPGPN
ncbi:MULTISPECIES: HAD family phosphatase [unclassified Streptomyces]|uniref:HAD family hydrolase n=1 Tax=unclassified Streptomyces TaxID=2593676 RepID=UPI0033DA0796